ncbi:MAG: leucine-rich repeat domain-containing protein [Lachnospiraceae bacterium]|nr:leucine-rich repeat domain-containing protein [Lachnospiraceae bacterium]MBQ9122066.1 leucine-rich repeat domain-containing protein [Lachnospiraceae bacterium]
MKKTIRRSVGALLIILALFLTQIPTTDVAADTSVASDFQLNNGTLVRYLGTASAVSIPATVNRIGEEAFVDCTTLKKISFKGEVEEFAFQAFAGCKELKEFIIPDSVVEIGNGTFANCTKLESIHIGKSLRYIGMGAFAGCESLKTITVDKENPYFTVEDGCLYSKDKSVLYTVAPVREKETYSMPSTVKEIAPYAFWGCNSIKNLSISNTIEVIPAYAFSNCKSLQGVSIPYSVYTIELEAFSDCINLEVVAIPPSVAQIHETAFDGCPKLEIAADIGTAAYTYYQKWLKTHSQQNEYEDTGNQDYEDDSDDNNDSENTGNGAGFNQDVLGQSVIVGNQAFVFIDNAAPVFGQDKNESEDTADLEDGTQAPEELIPSDEKSIDIPKFTIVNETLLADKAYYQSMAMQDFQIPDSITDIGEFAFARSNLSRIVIPEGVTSIGYGAFYHCDDLRYVEIPNTVTSIAPNAFEKTKWLDNYMDGGSEDFLIVGDGILLAYRGNDASITIPAQVKKIGPYVFEDRVELVEVTLPEGLREIGEGAFKGCYGLERINGGQYVTTIKDGAFDGCNVGTIHIWESVKSIGLGAINFAPTNKSVSTKVVVFDTKDTLPLLTYEENSTRLSSESARLHALEDVLVAIVDRQIQVEDLKGTVLDPDYHGFEGIVAYISSENRAEVTVMSCNMTKEELEQTYIPEYIYIDGKSYSILGLDKLKVFDDQPEENTISKDVLVVNEGLALSGGDRVTAWMEGDESSLELYIKPSVEGMESIKQAFYSVYKDDMPSDTLYLDMTLIEEKTGVSITKLGNNKMTIVLPASSCSDGVGSVRVVTLDRNGQLESVPLAIDQEGNLYLTVSHFSPFAIFRTMGGTGIMDDSPDTGDLFGIHPKWFLIMGMLCVALALIMYKPRKKKRK